MSYKPNPVLMKRLTEMGYSTNLATKALNVTQARSENDMHIAVEWILAHQDDKDIAVPVPVSPPRRGGSTRRNVDDLPPEIAEMQAYLDDTDPYKTVVIVNTDLNMGTGKVSTKVALAAIGTFKAMNRAGGSQTEWEQFGDNLMVLKGMNHRHLKDLELRADKIGCIHYLVKDESKSEATPGSITALGIYGKNNAVDEITDDLQSMY